jgi:predicted house-cleaning noncanonical NTP pyrophosphatase (MazG superfamily)
VRKTTAKLVRDGIPDIIAANGDSFELEELAEPDYQLALRAKLVEEAEEASVAEGGALVTELADLLEIVDALLAVSEISMDEVRATQQHKRATHGGFDRRIRLLWWTENGDRTSE